MHTLPLTSLTSVHGTDKFIVSFFAPSILARNHSCCLLRFRLQAVSAAGQSPFGPASTFTTLGVDEAQESEQALIRRTAARRAGTEFAPADQSKLLLAKQSKRAEARARAQWKRTKERITRYLIAFAVIGIIIVGVLFSLNII